jgi:hypothetical protein
MLFFSFAPDLNFPGLLGHFSFGRALSDSSPQLAPSSIYRRRSEIPKLLSQNAAFPAPDGLSRIGGS